jgi:hypothetical protein
LLFPYLSCTLPLLATLFLADRFGYSLNDQTLR